MSLGYNLTWREFDNSNFNTAAYSTTNHSAQVTLGLPITETDTVSALFGIDSNEILTFPGSTPQSIIDYIDALNQSTFHAWRATTGVGARHPQRLLHPDARHLPARLG